MSRMTGKIIRPAPAEIEFKNMRFLITEQPQEPDTKYSSNNISFRHKTRPPPSFSSEVKYAFIM